MGTVAATVGEGGGGGAEWDLLVARKTAKPGARFGTSRLELAEVDVFVGCEDTVKITKLFLTKSVCTYVRLNSTLWIISTLTTSDPVHHLLLI